MTLGFPGSPPEQTSSLSSETGTALRRSLLRSTRTSTWQSSQMSRSTMTRSSWRCWQPGPRMPCQTPQLTCSRYKLDENQSPNRMILQSAHGKVSPSAGAGTSEHQEWEKIEEKLFEGLYESSRRVSRDLTCDGCNVTLGSRSVSSREI
eukprot:764735-Hanusia_phi.AAC.1